MNLRDKAQSIMNIINSEEFSTKSLSFYLNSDLADELTNLLLDTIDLSKEDTEANLIQILDNNDFVSIVVIRDKRGDYFYAEAMFIEGEQRYDASDVFFIQDELVDIIDTTKLSDGEIIIMCDEEGNETDEFIDETMEDLLSELDSLNGNKCAYNVIKSYLLDMYETGYQGGIIDSIEQLLVNLKEQFIN